MLTILAIPVLGTGLYVFGLALKYESLGLFFIGLTFVSIAWFLFGMETER